MWLLEHLAIPILIFILGTILVVRPDTERAIAYEVYDQAREAYLRCARDISAAEKARLRINRSWTLYEQGKYGEGKEEASEAFRILDAMGCPAIVIPELQPPSLH